MYKPRFLSVVQQNAAHAAHKTETPVHMMYFGLVAWEAHGLYGIAAAVLLLIHFIKITEGPHVV